MVTLTRADERMRPEVRHRTCVMARRRQFEARFRGGKRHCMSRFQHHASDLRGRFSIRCPDGLGSRPGLGSKGPAAPHGYSRRRHHRMPERPRRPHPPYRPGEVRHRDEHRGGSATASGSRPSGAAIANDDLLDTIDGLLLTGSPSNVLPRHYGQPPSRPGTLHDPHRDETTLPLVHRCIGRGSAAARGLPRLPGDERRVRRNPAPARPRAARDAGSSPARGGRHRRPVRAGAYRHPGRGGRCCTDSCASRSSRSTRCTRRASIGSATGSWSRRSSPDGLVEAMSVEGCASFALAIQWHPEWNALKDPVSRAIFAAFGAACREHAGRRGMPEETVQARIA